MKIKSIILIALSSILISPSYCENQNVEPSQNQQVTQSSKTDYKDAFLNFALDKAKLYSEKGEAAVEKAVDTAMKEAPILANEYLKWKFLENSIKFAIPATIGFLSLILCCFYIFRANKYGWESDDFFSFNCLMVFVFGLVILVTFLVIDFDNLYTAIQIQVAPRVYILEQVLHMVK